MPSYVVDLARKASDTTARRLEFVRSFSIDADDDAAAIRHVQSMMFLATHPDVDAVVVFSGDRSRGVWNQMRSPCA